MMIIVSNGRGRSEVTTMETISQLLNILLNPLNMDINLFALTTISLLLPSANVKPLR